MPNLWKAKSKSGKNIISSYSLGSKSVSYQVLKMRHALFKTLEPFSLPAGKKCIMGCGNNG
jgi:hypothetical protein